MRSLKTHSKMTTEIPSEREEQIVLTQYLDLKGLPYFHVPNSTFTKSWKQKQLNKYMGVKPGVPDLFICVAGRMVAVELKRTKRGVISEYQRRWLDILNEHGVEAVVCKGADEAIKFIESRNSNGSERKV